VLYLTVSDDETRIGVCLGQKLIKDQERITEIAIYTLTDEESGKYELEKLRDFEFSDVCSRFYFDPKKPTALVFFSRNEIFNFDYVDESKDKEVIYELDN
jgi:hypothetical protein